MAFPSVSRQLGSLYQNDFDPDAVTLSVLAGRIIMTINIVGVAW